MTLPTLRKTLEEQDQEVADAGQGSGVTESLLQLWRRKRSAENHNINNTDAFAFNVTEYCQNVSKIMLEIPSISLEKKKHEKIVNQWKSRAVYKRHDYDKFGDNLKWYQCFGFCKTCFYLVAWDIPLLKRLFLMEIYVCILCIYLYVLGDLLQSWSFGTGLWWAIQLSVEPVHPAGLRGIPPTSIGHLQLHSHSIGSSVQESAWWPDQCQQHKAHKSELFETMMMMMICCINSESLAQIKFWTKRQRIAGKSRDDHTYCGGVNVHSLPIALGDLFDSQSVYGNSNWHSGGGGKCV